VNILASILVVLLGSQGVWNSGCPGIYSIATLAYIIPVIGNH